ncbi:MAG TPA: NADPH:quinone oxidoreductase family protein [Acidimicrobiia bacterium]|nr:NADPH:quinone oxidoreductase family protein [Acidimicrobiia bacterium]
MRRVVCRELGPPDRVEIEEVDAPEARGGKVVVAVRAAGVNFVDALLVQGKYQIKLPPPFTPGTELAGEITAIGEGVTGWSVGDRVTATTGMNAFAELAEVDARALRAVPDSMTFGQAATFVQSYETMLFAFRRRTTLREGETMLVLGAGGGIGLATIDLGRAFGLRAIAAASTQEKLAGAQAQGAFATIAYEEEDLKTRARELSDGGVDLVVDIVGGTHAEPALRALKPGGRYLVVGFASGTIPTLPLNQVLLNNRTVVGVDWGGWAMRNREEQEELEAELFALAAHGDLHPVEPASAPLADTGRVLTDLAERRIVGKMVITP